MTASISAVPLAISPELLFTQFLNGLGLAVLYLLMVSGLSVIFGITDIINFAHGALYMVGAYLAYTIVGAGQSFFVALLIAPLGVALLGAVIERFTLQRIYDREPLYHILLTFGFVLIITDLVELIWGEQPQQLPTPDILAGAVELGPIFYPKYRLFLIGAGLLIGVATYALFRYTTFGLIVRAGTQDKQTVRLLGVRLGPYFTLVFALGAFLAGAAGVLAGPFTTVDPSMGNSILITAFIIVIVGGMGSYLGSAIAAFVIAMMETLSVVFFPDITQYLIYLLMFGILLVRPQGILGSYEIRSEAAKISFSETISPVRLTNPKVLAVLGALALVPLGVERLFSTYVLGLLALMFIWGLFALSLDIVMGYLGLISFGHAAFYGVGAYAVALTVAHVSNSFLLAIAVAVAVTTALAWAIGALSVRFSGVYFAMITFAAAQLIYQFAVSTPELTGGSNGMSVQAPELFMTIDVTNPVVFYYLALGVLLGCYYLAVRTMDSPFGRVLTAIRESERRTSFLGYDVDKYKRRAFALSGAIGGLAGALFVTYQQFVSPNSLYWFVSGDVLFAMILGGIGTLYGPIIGGMTLIGLESLLSDYTEQWRLVFGVILVLIVMFAPRGLVSVFGRIQSTLDGGRSADAATAGEPSDESGTEDEQ